MFTSALRALSVSVVWIAWVTAAPIPTLDLAQLVQDSDVAVVGRVSTIIDAGAVAAPARIPARNLVATIDVDDVIKGVVENTAIRVTFIQPEVQVGIRSVSRDTYGMFFLRRSAASLEFTTAYYPYVPALPGFRTSRQSPTDRAFDVVSNVLRTDGASLNQIEAISVLRGSGNSIAVAALRDATGNPDSEIAMRSAAALLSVGDLAGLPVVAGTLQGNRTGLSDEAYVTVLGSLAQLKQPAALPTLDRLVTSGDSTTRKAAIQGLRNLRSPNAIPALVRALDDNDTEVRYHAVMALSETTKQTQWGPSIDAFAADEHRYITYWKDWAKTQK